VTELAGETTLLQEVTRRGFGGEQAAALMKLTDKSGISADGGATAAVEAAVAKYPALFTTPATPAPGVIPGATLPAVPPTLPPSSTNYSKGFETIDGFVTMEEYIRTPQSERLSDAFQARVARSEPFWPAEVPATSFAQDT
jgi:hypothetical protein